MNIMNELINKSLAHIGTLKLIERRPVYAYVNNAPTDQIIGYKYICVAPELSFSTVAVKILGEEKLKHITAPADVRFDGLEAVVYTNRGTNRPDISFRANNVNVLKGE